MSTALVTGGGRGIGQGIALRLAKEGMRVVVTARSADQLAETVRLSGGKIAALPADISQTREVSMMVSVAEREVGPIDLLVNNAGIGGPLTPLADSDPDEWWETLEVNLLGPYLCCRTVLPGMIARKSGRIINMASGAGTFPIPDMSAYVASKTALIRLSEQLAMEVKPHGISVFPIRPGVVRTAMVEEARGAVPLIQKILDEGQDVTPDTVADLVLFLASGKADRLSGRLFSVNEDLEEIVSRADEVERDNLYLLRTRRL
uniref:Short-chain dehydrogenase/reductase SDR n=1 Tax=Solibacter usitatus (strain Ellin6076) TaxID=234267 RepID=Q01TZ9_SOLUE